MYNIEKEFEECETQLFLIRQEKRIIRIRRKGINQQLSQIEADEERFAKRESYWKQQHIDLVKLKQAVDKENK